jgi:hypothetical protein
MREKFNQIALILTTTSSLIGLILVTYTNLDATSDPVHLALSNQFSYFTVQSNLIIALCCLFMVITKKKLPQIIEFGSLLNITITGLVYAFILAGIWQPEGLVFIADALLHYVTPLLYVLLWITSNKGRWKPKQILLWTIYPVGYLIYTLIRGRIVEFYPYPFIDASELNMEELIMNIGVMSSLFLFIGVCLYVINNKLNS